MPVIELLFSPDCPHVDVARAQLRRACEEVGVPPAWTERDLAAKDTPDHLRTWGSPTILVDGEDVCGAARAGGSSCRVYARSEVAGAPSVATIVEAITRATAQGRS